MAIVHEGFRIVVGQEYAYKGDLPPHRKGHRYRVARFVLLVPVYQQLVLVECLTGPDTGLWFACSPANFATRYEPLEEPVEEKIAGTVTKGSGV